MNRIIYALVLFTLLAGCSSNKSSSIKIELLKKELVYSIFNNIKDWDNQHITMMNYIHTLDSLDTFVRFAPYDSLHMQIICKTDSLHHIQYITKHLDSIAVSKSAYKQAQFWRDTTKNGGLLVTYSTFPDPTNKTGYYLEITKRTQE